MKKALIITYYWPPSGGGGVQRWLKFAKYLPEFGWEPVIFTPENPDFAIQDSTLMYDVSDDLEVIKLPIWEPYQLFEKVSGHKAPAQGLVSSGKKKSLFTKMALWVRGNFFIPDPRKFWVKPSVKFLKDFIERNEIDTIITTGPPHSMHLIGLDLKKKMGIRWVVDFRDPWSRWDMLNNFKLSSFTRNRHKKLELEVLKLADEVITVSNTWAREFNEIYSRDYSVITNGYDSDDFKNVSKKKPSRKFVISHFGLINNFRNPFNFWKALKKVSANDDIEVRLYGMVEASIQNYITSDSELNKIVDLRKSIPHEEVLKAYADSDLLLLLLNDSDNAMGHIPGKLFEYLASQRTILAFGAQTGDAAEIILKTGAGVVMDYNETDVEKTIVTLMNSKRDFRSDAKNLFTRKKLTQQLVNDVLNNNAAT